MEQIKGHKTTDRPSRMTQRNLQTFRFKDERRETSGHIVSTRKSYMAKNDLGTAAYRNPRYSTEQRVKDLLERMTLEEKVRQMGFAE